MRCRAGLTRFMPLTTFPVRPLEHGGNPEADECSRYPWSGRTWISRFGSALLGEPGAAFRPGWVSTSSPDDRVGRCGAPGRIATAIGERGSSSEDDYIALLDRAHQRLQAPIQLIWDNLRTHVTVRMRELIGARRWLTSIRSPACPRISTLSRASDAG